MTQPPNPLAALSHAILLALTIAFVPTQRSVAQESHTALVNPSNAQFQVQKVEVKGSTLFSEQELEVILAEATTPKTIAISDLQKVADQITQLYVERGFLTSRAIVPPQSIKEGVVTIAIIEGTLADIQVEGLESLRAGYVRSRLQQRPGMPLNAHKLEEKLRLLKTDPLFESVESSLRPGNQPGESVLRVKVKESKTFKTTLSTDNGSQSLQPEKSRMTATYKNILGLGDELLLSSSMKLDASAFEQDKDTLRNYEIAYRMPVNAMNGTVQVQAAVDDKSVTESAFAALGIRNRSEQYSIGFRQPLVRSLREEFAVSLSFEA
jgi:hemolysin activation/secretion protein